MYNTSRLYTGTSKRDEHAAAGFLEKRKGIPGCKVVCSVDEKVNVTGTPALLYNSTGTTLGWRGDGLGGLAWIPVVLVGSAVFGLL
jgi:hypothetical protein